MKRGGLPGYGFPPDGENRDITILTVWLERQTCSICCQKRRYLTMFHCQVNS